MVSRLQVHALFFAVFVSAGPAAGQEGIELEVVPLTEHAFMVRHMGSQATNLIALESRDGIVVIDAGISGEIASAARTRIEETFGRSDFSYLINTHAHGDHTYGNQAFADIRIVGHEGVPREMEENESQRERTLEQVTLALGSLRERLGGLDPESDGAGRLRETVAYYEILVSGLGDGFQLTPPTVTFQDRTVLDLGDRTLVLSHYGKSHSDTDILVFCPEEGLLATGDLFAEGIDPYLDSERVSAIPRWLENLDWVLGDARGVKVVAPAHGELIPLEELGRVRDYVRIQADLLQGKSSAFVAFKQAFESGGPDAALARMEEWKKRPDEFYFFHAEFDSFVYGLMMEEELETAIPLFEKLAALFPDVPNAHDSLGEAYLRAGRTEEAAGAFEVCLELDAEHPNATRRLAEIKGSDPLLSSGA